MLMIVASLQVLIRSCASGSVWTMTRHVEMKKLTLLNVASEVAGLLVSLVWVLVSATAWALVVGRVVSAAAFMIGSHLLADYRPTLAWDRRAARDILAFGTPIALATATYFLCGEAERLIVAKFITVAELGCFSVALTLADAPSQAVSQVVGQVFYPVIAESIREDEARALTHYKKARSVCLAAGLILGVGVIAYGPRVVSLLLPPKFAMAGWMLQLLGWRAAHQVFSAPATSYVLASGDSKPLAASNVVRLVLMLAGLAVAFTLFGLHAAVAVLAFSGAIAYAIVVIPALQRRLRPAMWPELSGFLVFLAATALAAIVPWPWR
jgi:O-antigen/teichoic acid export membrane protein